MELKVNKDCFISSIRRDDIPFYIQHLKEKEIYDRTLSIPFPYNLQEAEWWIAHLEKERQNFKRDIKFAIRNPQGELIGGIGFSDFCCDKHSTHKAEIGYWLAKEYWGKGIMPACVAKFCEFGFQELKLVRIYAHIFEMNAQSVRVVEKCDFQFEGRLKKYYLKDGKIFDCLLYAKIK